MSVSTHESVSTNARDEMLSINAAQRRFYERQPTRRGNWMTRVWRAARQEMWRQRETIGATHCVQQLHRQWLGDLKGKRVLDLGCYSGNDLSLEIAAQCGSYLGLDLSQPAVEQLDQELRGLGLSHAQARCGDFLASEFDNECFDVVYACSVMHHFKHLEVFLSLLRNRLSPGGRVVSVDAMDTSWPIWLARRVYRPFQSDADWEYPFQRKSLRLIDEYFHIESIQGILGAAKWGLPFLILPGGSRLAQRLHEHDVRHANRQGRALWRCMQVAMVLRRRREPPERECSSDMAHG